MDNHKKVKADIQCPFCGLCKIIKIGSHRKAVNCQECRQPIFLKWATGIEGEVDDRGFYFKATEPFNINKINREFRDAFVEDCPYWIR